MLHGSSLKDRDQVPLSGCALALELADDVDPRVCTMSRTKTTTELSVSSFFDMAYAYAIFLQICPR